MVSVNWYHPWLTAGDRTDKPNAKPGANWPRVQELMQGINRLWKRQPRPISRFKRDLLLTSHSPKTSVKESEKNRKNQKKIKSARERKKDNPVTQTWKIGKLENENTIDTKMYVIWLGDKQAQDFWKSFLRKLIDARGAIIHRLKVHWTLRGSVS